MLQTTGARPNTFTFPAWTRGPVENPRNGQEVDHVPRLVEGCTLQGMDTYPTWGKGKSSSKVPIYGIC